MNRPRDQLFPGAALSDDEHGATGRSRGTDALKNVPHAWTLPDNPVKVLAGVHVRGETRRLAFQSLRPRLRPRLGGPKVRFRQDHHAAVAELIKRQQQADLLARLRFPGGLIEHDTTTLFE